MSAFDWIIAAASAALAFVFGALLAGVLEAIGLGFGWSALVFGVALVLGLMFGALRDALNSMTFRVLDPKPSEDAKKSDARLSFATRLAFAAGLGAAFAATRVWSPDALLSWL